MLRLLKSFVADDKAAEVTELGIILVLIVAVCIATIGLIGGKISTAYNTVNTDL